MRLNRLIHLLVVQLRNQILAWSGSWWFLVALAAGQIVPAIVSLEVWSSPGDATSSTLGYYLVVLLFCGLTASYENFTFSEKIYSGELAQDLVRPQPVVLSPIGENIAIRLWIGLVTIPVAMFFGSKNLHQIGLVDVGAFVLLVILSGILRFLFTWCLALVAFWTDRVHSIVALSSFLLYALGGVLCPVSFLPGDLPAIVRFLPFYPMIGMPAEFLVLTGTMSLAHIVVIDVAWLLTFAILGTALWRRGLRRYSCVGA